MNASLPRTVDRFTNFGVMVLGDTMLDAYLQGVSSRLCPEAPAPVVDLLSRQEVLGGAANSARNLRSLGARPFLLSVIGDDAEGASMRDCLDSHEIEGNHILVERGRRTLAKQRVLASDHLMLRLDQGDTGPVAEDVEAALIERMERLWDRCSAVLISDYGYGVLTDRVIARLVELQAASPRVLVVDSKRLPRFREARPTAIKPNFGETLRLLGEPGPIDPTDRAEWVIRRGPRILDLAGSQLAAITMDIEGALLFERDRPPYRTFARAEPSSHASGAGDTFAAVLTLALAAGADAPAAADLASAASAVVVAKAGTASCTAAELRERVRPTGKAIRGIDELAECVQTQRRAGRRIVFTNGCFDLLHRGHISYLSRAKAMGDILIVGVNSDAGIRRLKGPSRPINGLDDRLQVLSALSCVDYVVSFDEETPHALIRIVRPDVFVKGGDYTRESLPEAPLVEELGGIVEIMPFLADRSTTDIITKIRRAYGDSPELRADGPVDGSGEVAVMPVGGMVIGSTDGKGS